MSLKKKPCPVVKKWLSLPEAMAFMDMGQTSFLKLATDSRLTVSVIGSKKYFKVAELEKVIEDHIIIHQQ
jgi:hypothetical protein